MSGRVVVTDVCEGHALCIGLAPEVFDMDDVGARAIVSADIVPDELVPSVRRAVASCPVQAIVYTEDET